MRYEPEQLKADREARERAQHVSDGYKLRVHNLEVENAKLKEDLDAEKVASCMLNSQRMAGDNEEDRLKGWLREIKHWWAMARFDDAEDLYCLHLKAGESLTATLSYALQPYCGDGPVAPNRDKDDLEAGIAQLEDELEDCRYHFDQMLMSSQMFYERTAEVEKENAGLKAALARVKGKLNCRQDYEADTDGAYGPGFCIGKADMSTVDALLADIPEPVAIYQMKVCDKCGGNFCSRVKGTDDFVCDSEFCDGLCKERTVIVLPKED